MPITRQLLLEVIDKLNSVLKNKDLKTSQNILNKIEIICNQI